MKRRGSSVVGTVAGGSGAAGAAGRAADLAGFLAIAGECSRKCVSAPGPRTTTRRAVTRARANCSPRPRAHLPCARTRVLAFTARALRARVRAWRASGSLRRRVEVEQGELITIGVIDGPGAVAA